MTSGDVLRIQTSLSLCIESSVLLSAPANPAVGSFSLTVFTVSLQLPVPCPSASLTAMRRQSGFFTHEKIHRLSGLPGLIYVSLTLVSAYVFFPPSDPSF